MRKRNNRVAIRMTEDEYENLNKMASQSIFPKEKLIRFILAGYQIQQKPNADFQKLVISLRKLSAQLASMYNKFCFSFGSIGEEMYQTKNAVYSVDCLLRNSNYIMYGKLRKKRINVKK